MRFLLLLALALLPAASPALTLDPTVSAITPAVGAPAPLTGTLQVDIGELPITGNTTFDVLSFLATTAGGISIRLDPASPSPGLGVIDASGSFLVPTLFLEIEDGAAPFPLAIPGVTGQVFDAAGTSLQALSVDPFEIDSGGPAGILTVTLLALPAPVPLILFGLTAAIAVRRTREGR